MHSNKLKTTITTGVTLISIVFIIVWVWMEKDSSESNSKQNDIPVGMSLVNVSANHESKQNSAIANTSGSEFVNETIKTSSSGLNKEAIVLIGTILGNPLESYAIIRQVTTNRESSYRTGEQIFDQGRLVAINRDYIELQTADGRVRLDVKGNTPYIVSEATKKDGSILPNSNQGTSVARESSMDTHPGQFVARENFTENKFVERHDFVSSGSSR